MPTPSFRRALLLTVPLVIVLAACQGKSVAGPDLGDTGLAVGEQALVGQPASIHCTSEQLEAVAPCQGEDVGSVCTPENNAVVEWNPESQGAQNVYAPELTWTYPCVPDGYSVELWSGVPNPDPWFGDYITADDPEFGGPSNSWLPSMPLWESGHRYAYTISAWLDDDDQFGDKLWSDMATIYFYTGPFCVEIFITPPELVWPYNGHVFREPEQSQEGFSPEAWYDPNADNPPNLVGPGGECKFPDLPPCATPKPAILIAAGFTWEYSSGECLPQSEGQVSTDSTFATGVMPLLTSSPMEVTGGAVGGSVEWCHTYYWRVRSRGGVVTGPWSETYSFDIVPTGEGECGILHASIDAVATNNVSCRVGPGTAYAIGTYVPAGERHAVDGRNADGTWLRLRDLGCYINRELLTLEVGGTPFPGGADVGDLMSALPVLPDPPLPTVPPKVCKPTMGQAECEATSGKWVRDMSVVGAPIYKCDCP